MNQLFISYSRKDTDFARKLTTRFEAENIKAWVDWQDIPPSTDWRKEIQTGIEEADIFLFVISPDSIKSTVCEEEMAHAVLNGKRMIPVIARDIDAKEAPAAITHLNWIFFSRPQDNFDESFEKALHAIRTDYDWVQTHARFQVKALEWERNNQEDSLLLRGKELADAKAQLMVNGQKDPHPTEIQRRYITKSSEVEEELIARQRAKETQFEMEKNTGLRLRRLTYLLLGVFTIAYIALFIWLYQVTSALAVNSIKNQMLALVETTVCFMYGDKFDTFVNTYSPKDNSVYDADYYKELKSYMHNVKDMNENIDGSEIVLYTIIKGNKANEYVIVNSTDTTKDIAYKTTIPVLNLDSIQIMGMTKTITDTKVFKNESGTWISACSPILNTKGKSVGALCADFNAKLLDDTRKKITSTLGFAFLAIYPAMIVLVLFTTRSMSKKVRQDKQKQA